MRRRRNRQRRIGFEKNIQDLETIQQDLFDKIKYARAELHTIIKIFYLSSINHEDRTRVTKTRIG